MKKRALSLLLAILLIVSLLPTMAFAGDSGFAITNGTPESAKESNHGDITIDKTTAAEGKAEDETGKETGEESLYTVTIDAMIVNGTVAVAMEGTSFAEGDEINLDIKPNDGYVLSSVKANDAELTLGEDDQYSFAMPADNVIVTAEFDEMPALLTVNPSTAEAETVAKIDDNWYETLADAVTAATESQTIVIVKADTYTLPNIPANITIKAADGVEVMFDCTADGNICSIPNGVTFENVKFSFGQSNYTGFQHAGLIIMKNCTINGLFFSYGDMNFTGCTFNQTQAEYCMWLYGNDVTLTGCTFNAYGKFFNVYNEGNSEYTITVNGCTANNLATSGNKAVFNSKETCGRTILNNRVVLMGANTYTGPTPTNSAVLNSFVQVDDRAETKDETKDGKNGVRVTVAAGATLNGETLPVGELYATNPSAPAAAAVVVVEVTADNSNGITPEIAQAINANTAIKAEGATNVDKVEGVETLTIVATSKNQSKVTFTVEPKDEHGIKVSSPTQPITFRLPYVGSSDKVKLYHENDLLGYADVKGEANNQYVEVTSGTFSDFSYEDLPEGTVAVIGETPYTTLAAAIDAAGNNDTIQMLANVAQPTAININNKIIKLDLNNHELSWNGTESLFVIGTGGTLNLYDNGTTVTRFKQSTGDENKRYWVKDSNGDKTVTGGYILGGTNLNNTNGLIQVNGGTFNMYGGTVVGTKNSWDGWSTAGVWVQTGTFNMHGGAFKGCNARDGVIETSGTASATVNIYGGALIENCTSFNCAGAIFLRGNTDFNMYGGTIKDCVAYAHGGAINAKGENCNIQLYGGKIIDNKTGYKTDDNMGGGGVCIEDSYVHVTVGGDIKLTGNERTNGKADNLWLNSSNKVSLGTGDNVPKSGMSVGVTTQTAPTADAPVPIATNGTANDAKYFTSDIENCSVVFNDEDNNLELAAGHVHDGKTFAAWNSTTSLPTTSGSYYLTNDVTFGGNQCVIPSGANIDLCLNGHVITLNGTGGGNNNISINLGASLNLYDCGTAEHKFTVDANGLWTLNESATENYETVTGGVITGGRNGIGGAIYLSWSDANNAIGATLNMYGGNIVGNQSTSTSQGGGAVFVDRPSTFNMCGGKIIGNTAKNGGAVYIYSNAGKHGTFNMSDGEIRNNKATEFGGGVYVSSDAVFNMSGGTIAGCSAQKGGGVFTWGNMTMSGNGAIRDCTATVDGGGVCACNCAFSMAGNSMVSNCVADNGGGGVYTWSGGEPSGASFTMSGASMIEKCVAKYTGTGNLRSGGGLCVENSTFTMTGGAITNNTSATDGGGVCFMSGTATLGGTAKITDSVKGGTISGGALAGGTANNIYLPDNKYITLGTNDDAPASGFSVGVTTQTAPTNGSPVKITTNGASAYTSYFTPDNDAYEVKFNADHLELTVPHVHTFTYAANNGKITATCTDGCDKGYDTMPLTLTLTAPESLVYDGNVKAFTFADGEADAWEAAGLELPDIIYCIKQSGQSAYMPLLETLKAVGNYMAKITVGGTDAQVEFTIDKATPYIKTNPAPSDIAYGQKLSDSTLFGGYVQVSSTNSTEVTGRFTWTNPDTVPGINDSEVTEYDVTFTPTDTNNYNTVSCKVKIKVNHTHTPVLVNGQAATETTAGWKDYYECGCGDFFEDATGLIPITDLNAWKAQGGNGYIPPLASASYTVTFNMGGHGTAPANQTVNEGGKATKPASDPTADGWTFGGWYADATFNVAFDFDSAINANTTIYAKWTENPPASAYIIIAGANSEWTKGTTAGLLITSDAPFAKFDCVKVDGSTIATTNYTAEEGSTKITLSPAYLETLSVGTHSIEIVSNDGSASTSFAVKAAVPPVPTSYTVTFNMNGHGTQITAQTVESGSKATKPADPTASGYTFGGWYADATFSAKFDFNTAITANTTVYAKWTKNSVAPTDPTSPQTGDNSHMFLWIALLFVSGGALVGTAIYGKKRKRAE